MLALSTYRYTLINRKGYAMNDLLRLFPSKPSGNGRRIILSLFDHSLVWCGPYIKNGYTVIPFDIQDDGIDLLTCESSYIAGDIIGDKLDRPPYEVYGILAAVPCTEFAVSGARWFKEKDRDGRTEKAVQLLKRTIGIINYFSYDPRTNTIAEFDADEAYLAYPDAGLRFWALENPVGRINRLHPYMKQFGPKYFEPYWYGSPYTKKTGLWGIHNFPEPTNKVEPTEGSRMHKLFPSPERANIRSKTDENFSNAFYQVNQ